jgi:integrase
MGTPPLIPRSNTLYLIALARRRILGSAIFRLKGKKPLSASIIVQKYLRPAAIKAGVIKEDQRVRFGFHNFPHSPASSMLELKCDPKTAQGILRHEDLRTTTQLYARCDQESRLEAQGNFLVLLLGDKAHLLTETIR